MFAAKRPKMTQFNIEVVSDTVCPWCYVGKKKLDKAIEEYKLKHPESKDTFTTTWKPYFLNPSAPKIGMSSLRQRPFTSRFWEVIQSTDTMG
jgi:predicted DsbA family dithiol-disulfide isomerase